MPQQKSGGVGRGGWFVVFQMLMLGSVVACGLLWNNAWRSALSWWVGVCLLILSGLTGLAGAWALGSNLTPYPVPGHRARLVQTGVYAFIRHPLYAALLTASFGWGFLKASPAALAALLPLAILLNAKAEFEEQALLARFPEYENYRRGVKKFVPGIW